MLSVGSEFSAPPLRRQFLVLWLQPSTLAYTANEGINVWRVLLWGLRQRRLHQSDDDQCCPPQPHFFPFGLRFGAGGALPVANAAFSTSSNLSGARLIFAFFFGIFIVCTTSVLIHVI